MNLLEEYKNVANKLKKTQRVVFKKQNTKELSNEFNHLALKFDKLPSLSNYGGLCLLGAAKCYENSENYVEAQSSLLKGARMFRKSNDTQKTLGCISNHSDIEGAHRCYSQALSFEKDSVMKACIIREFKEIHSNLSITSDFSSNAHRIYELHLASNNNIRSGDYITALEKLTEIIEDFSERKCEHLYSDVLTNVEITILLLLLILPANNHYSPSHVKTLQKFSWNNENFGAENSKLVDDSNFALLLEMLVHSCQNKEIDSVKAICDEISCLRVITEEQKLLLESLLKKYDA